MAKSKKITDPKEKAKEMLKEIIKLEGRMTYISNNSAKLIAKQRVGDVISTLEELIEVQDSVGHAVGMVTWWRLVGEYVDCALL